MSTVVGLLTAPDNENRRISHRYSCRGLDQRLYALNRAASMIVILTAVVTRLQIRLLSFKVIITGLKV
jgi:hypothetical protein